MKFKVRTVLLLVALANLFLFSVSSKTQAGPTVTPADCEDTDVAQEDRIDPSGSETYHRVNDLLEPPSGHLPVPSGGFGGHVEFRPPVSDRFCDENSIPRFLVPIQGYPNWYIHNGVLLYLHQGSYYDGGGRVIEIPAGILVAEPIEAKDFEKTDYYCCGCDIKCCGCDVRCCGCSCSCGCTIM